MTDALAWVQMLSRVDMKGNIIESTVLLLNVLMRLNAI